MLYEILLAGICIFFVYYVLRFRANKRKWQEVCSKVTPLGPKHPIWGSLHLFANAEEFGKITKDLVQRTRTKIFCYWIMFFYPHFAVCHPDTARVLFKSTMPKPKDNAGGIYRLITSWIGDGLLVSSGKKWERSRHLLTPAFHFDILKPYILEYNQVADSLIDNLQKCMEKDGNVEIYQRVSLATLDTMLRCSLSYENNVQEIGEEHSYVAAVNRLAALVILRCRSPWYFSDIIYNISPPGREYRKLCNYVHEFSESIIASRKAILHKDPGQHKKRRLDFLDILLTAKDESGKGLSDTDIRAEVDTFLFEGHDTTASAISWAIYALGKYPTEQEIVFEEISEMLKDKQYFEWDDVHNATKLTYFLKEVMRMYSTVPFASRWLTEPLVFEGVELPADCTVDFNFHAMNHHPDVWPDHEEFKPERFKEESFHDRDPFSYTPFSAGSRNCIGQHFALNEQRVLVARVVKRYKVHLVQDHVYDINPELVMRPKYGIKVILEERH